MSFPEQLRAVRERWFLVLLALIVGGGCAATVFATKPVEYTASLTMYVAAPGTQDPSSAALNGQLAQQRVKSYLELIQSRAAAEEVVRVLGLPDTPDDLLARISASNPLDSVVLMIDVTDGSPEKAAAEANAFGSVFGRMATELDTREGITDGSNLTLRVVQPAAVPTAPSSPGAGLVVGLGLVAGLFVGVVGAVLARRFDRRVRTAEALAAATNLPVLGTLSRQENFDRDALMSDRAVPFSDDVRRLRAGLAAAYGGPIPRSLLVTSADQGAGRTTVVVALAIHLASIGKRVLVVDGDLRRPRIDEVLGLGPAAGLSSVLTGQSSLEQAIRPWNSRVFDVLSSGPVPEDPGPMLAGPGIRSLLSDMCVAYDVVLVDSPPVLPVADAGDLASHVEGVVVLGRPDSAIADVELAVARLRSSSRRLVGAVLVMTKPSTSKALQRYVSDPASPLMSSGADRPIAPLQQLNGPSPSRPGAGFVTMAGRPSSADRLPADLHLPQQPTVAETDEPAVAGSNGGTTTAPSTAEGVPGGDGTMDTGSADTVDATLAANGSTSSRPSQHGD